MPPITPIVKNLFTLTSGFFLAQNLLDLDLVTMLGLRCILSDHFRPYQFFTHLFVHANLGHLFSNMLALLTLGPILEHTLHTKKFITFYILTGLGAATLYAGIQYVEIRQLATLYRTYWEHPDPQSFLVYLRNFPHHTYDSLYSFITDFFAHPNDQVYINKGKEIVRQLYTKKADIPTVGASGSVFGIFTAFAMLFPNTELLLFFIPFPIKAKYMIAIYGIYELYAGIQNNPTDNVAHFAHLGGVLLAYVFVRWWKKRDY